MSNFLIDRIRGVAVGAAVGDALGMPLEFTSQRPMDNLVTSMLPGRIPAGSFTDDTEMALAVAESIVNRNQLDPVDLSSRFILWMRENPPDIGIHTREVLQRISSGQDWLSAAASVQKTNPDSAGNGSVMRCWPVAIKWHQDTAFIIYNSILQSQITHPHPDCVAACAFINVTIAHLINGSSPTSAIKQACQDVELPIALRDVIQQAPEKTRQQLPNTGWVRHTIESAVWGLISTDNFEDALINVVNLGYDADTAGAVVGALAGAAYGLDAIPTRWRSLVHGEYPLGSRKIYREFELMRLADKLGEPHQI